MIDTGWGWIPLRAGGLTLAFDPQTAGLRRIAFRGIEVLGGIYAAVRDHNWDTVAGELSGLSITESGDSFLLQFEMRCRSRDVDFVWKGRIQGSADERISYEFSGEARRDFRRNRIGFCVLHPVRGVAGMPCWITHCDGTEESGHFPKRISPYQPFRSIRAIRHVPAPGLTAKVEFAGDEFEMEDQRNWTDASFKTYCTPLERPFPVALTCGSVISQTVSLRVETWDELPEVGDREPAIWVECAGGEAAPIGELPRLGIGLGRVELNDSDAEALRALNLHHLRADVTSEADLAFAFVQAGRVGVPLEVGLHAKGINSATGVVFAGESPAQWLIYGGEFAPASGELYRGTDAYFAELNRNPPNLSGGEGVVFSISPQVHAFDDASIMETLEAQSAVVESAREIANGGPVAVSPITLLPRFNPNATDPTNDPPLTDPRQSSTFTAAWTLGSIAALGKAGARSATYFEAIGPRGILDGTSFPVYEVFRALAAFSGAAIQESRSATPSDLCSLLLKADKRRALFLANLTPNSILVDVREIGSVALGPFGWRGIDF